MSLPYPHLSLLSTAYGTSLAKQLSTPTTYSEQGSLVSLVQSHIQVPCSHPTIQWKIANN